MFVLGIVLIAAAIVVGLGVASTSGLATTLELYGIDLGMSVSAVFFFGAALGAVVVAGLWMTKLGVSHGYRRRKEVKELRQQVETTTTPDKQVETASDKQAETTPDKQVETSPAAPGGDTSEEVAKGTDTVAEGTDHPRSPERPIT